MQESLIKLGLMETETNIIEASGLYLSGCNGLITVAFDAEDEFTRKKAERTIRTYSCAWIEKCKSIFSERRTFEIEEILSLWSSYEFMLECKFLDIEILGIFFESLCNLSFRNDLDEIMEFNAKRPKSSGQFKLCIERLMEEQKKRGGFQLLFIVSLLDGYRDKSIEA